MRRTGAMIVVAALLLGASSGCGTMLNMDGKERLDFDSRDVDLPPRYQRPMFPFGGVANDVAWIKSAKEPIDVTLSLMDMPFSFAGDVLTFPWAAYQCLIVARPAARDESASSLKSSSSSTRSAGSNVGNGDQ